MVKFYFSLFVYKYGKVPFSLFVHKFHLICFNAFHFHFYLQAFISFFLIIFFFLFAGFHMLSWLHWKFDYTQLCLFFRVVQEQVQNMLVLFISSVIRLLFWFSLNKRFATTSQVQVGNDASSYAFKEVFYYPVSLSIIHALAYYWFKAFMMK